ncbi:hypothetical protein BDV96DRAFT_596684 [Lophiotrema nucula]|uniref:Histone deacetylase n=1 Tax=Lophiotrema nucula TaxID=690887 RepID=A0A6A5ZH54_9PLEO|nr:hypothetical protein BDV96DRAFT_596684 [Lophiotrema nucula]
MDEDYPMGEDTVVASTEINGNHSSAIPDHTNISAQANGFHVRKQQLPLLNNASPARSSTKPRTPFSGDVPSTTRSDIRSASVGSEEMDLSSDQSDRVQVRIPPPPKFPPLPYSSSTTGLVYDSRMRFHAEPTSLMTAQDDIHPEDPRRIHEIFNEIQQAGLVQGPEEVQADAKEEQCWRIQARPAEKAEICLIHTPEHFDFIETLQFKTEEELNQHANQSDSIYYNNSTYECAKLAAGGAIEACRAVVRGDVRNAIAIIRPPGHHAECDTASGFCIFNNVPIAAKVCQNDFPDTCRKILILDWDVHHGNGIQHVFERDPNILYISLHVFKNAGFYPFLEDANYNYCGIGAGLGRNVNIPWSDHGMGDAEYLYAFQEVVMPIATEFDPDFVIISAGFDAAEGDVLGGCHVTPACYAHMTHMLMSLANGKVAVCLEGGYNLRSIARSALAVTRTLMLQPPDRLDQPYDPKESAIRVIERVKREQSKYWKCLYPKQLETDDPSFPETKRLHDIIREWQSQKLADEHQMIPLSIRRSVITETFEHNVIATPGFMDARPLLVIFHDPPGIMGKADPFDGRPELHNTWLTDVNKSYIDWAVKSGFEVIDVNIPRVVAFDDEDIGFVKADSPEMRASQTRELANYIWENYIEPHDATQVFFMGVGAAYLGLVELLGNNENTTAEDSPVECLIGFVSQTSIQSVKRATDDNISSWYYDHSLVFVAKSHHVWDPIRQRKLRRKYGNLKRSGHDELNEMLLEHQSEIQSLLLKKKSEYEEQEEQASIANRVTQELLKHPPLSSRTGTPKLNNLDGGHGSVPAALRSPRDNLPPMGYFSVSSNSPRSPRSPMKRTF